MGQCVVLTNNEIWYALFNALFFSTTGSPFFFIFLWKGSSSNSPWKSTEKTAMKCSSGRSRVASVNFRKRGGEGGSFGWAEWVVWSGNKFSCLPKHKPLASNTNPKQQITEITFAMQSASVRLLFQFDCLTNSTACALICASQSCQSFSVLSNFQMHRTAS